MNISQQKKINKGMKVQGACLYQVDWVEVFVLSEYRVSPTIWDSKIQTLFYSGEKKKANVITADYLEPHFCSQMEPIWEVIRWDGVNESKVTSRGSS